MSIVSTRNRCLILSLIASVVSNIAISTTVGTSTTTVSYNCSGQNLTNTVVYEGTQGVPFPRIDNGQPVQWQILSSSEFFNFLKTIYYYNGTLNPSYNTSFAVNQTELTVLNSTTAPQQSMPVATSGIYILNYYNNPNCTTAANLIVIRSGPTCHCNASDPKNVTLFCGIDFAEASSQPNNPVLTWVNSSNSVVKREQPTPSQTSTYMKRSKSNVTVSANDVSTYTCQLTFGATPSSPLKYMTTTPPTFSASCSISNCLFATNSTTNLVSNPVTTATSPPLNCSGQNLTNQVVYENSSSSFRRLNNGQQVQWQVVSSSDFFNTPKTISNYDGTVVSTFNSSYSVNSSQLIVLNSTVTPRTPTMPYATAGLYIIRYLNPNCTYAANLIVIREGPVCSCDASNTSNIRLSCKVDFAGASAQPNTPIFTWRNSTSEVKSENPTPNQFSSYMKRSSSQITVTDTDPEVYECQLTFSIAKPPSSLMNYITTAAPDFSASCFQANCGMPHPVPSDPDAGA